MMPGNRETVWKKIERRFGIPSTEDQRMTPMPGVTKPKEKTPAPEPPRRDAGKVKG